jgi:hypothetical protein
MRLRIGSGRSSGAGKAGQAAPLIVRWASTVVVLVGLGTGCVDLTKPQVLLQTSTGGTIGPVGSGGTGVSAGGTSGTTTGGAPGVGGTVGAGGLPGTGGAGQGGATLDAAGPDAAGGATGTTDAPIATGGIVGAGGIVIDADNPGLGGTVGTGGMVGTGGATTGAGTGGKTGNGGAAAGGTTTASGGTMAGTGGVTGSGGVTGTGGVIGTGGVPGTGGTTTPATGGSSGLNCAAAIVPANGSSATSGVVTDFTDWNATTSRWGSTSGLSGTIYTYSGNSATVGTPKVEKTPSTGTLPQGLHITGSVPASGYAGGGLSFLSCVNVATFTKVQFNIYGGAPGCAVELQLQTFDQRPTNQTPPGGCVVNDAGAGCFTFPAKSQVVDVSTTITTPKTVTTTMSGMTNWVSSGTGASAGQIVGIQWQFTHVSGSGNCPVDATISDVRFVP